VELSSQRRKEKNAEKSCFFVTIYLEWVFGHSLVEALNSGIVLAKAQRRKEKNAEKSYFFESIQ
jgi:hypothetical protein